MEPGDDHPVFSEGILDGVFDDSQIWLMIGINSGVVALLVLIGVIVNAYITSRRLANVLSDVEEIIHSDLKNLEEKIDNALTKLRISEARVNRD